MSRLQTLALRRRAREVFLRPVGARPHKRTSDPEIWAVRIRAPVRSSSRGEMTLGKGGGVKTAHFGRSRSILDLRLNGHDPPSRQQEDDSTQSQSSRSPSTRIRIGPFRAGTSRA